MFTVFSFFLFEIWASYTTSFCMLVVMISHSFIIHSWWHGLLLSLLYYCSSCPYIDFLSCYCNTVFFTRNNVLRAYYFTTLSAHARKLCLVSKTAIRAFTVPLVKHYYFSFTDILRLYYDVVCLVFFLRWV